MRQTFADEIINAGWGFPEDTVIFTNNAHLNELGDLLTGINYAESVCLPPFKSCFVQQSIRNEIDYPTSEGNVGVYFFSVQQRGNEEIFHAIVFAKDNLEPIASIDRNAYQVIFKDGKYVDFFAYDDIRPLAARHTDLRILEEHDRIHSFGNITIGLMNFYLLHQKADVELVTPTRQVSRQIERKTGKKPSPYFEIKVDPSKTQKRYTSTQKTGRSKNAHIVRGNFATYTADAPLFGRLTGTFFRPAHARGVTDGDKPEPKNYRIVLPKDES